MGRVKDIYGEDAVESAGCEEHAETEEVTDKIIEKIKSHFL